MQMQRLKTHMEIHIKSESLNQIYNVFNQFVFETFYLGLSLLHFFGSREDRPPEC